MNKKFIKPDVDFSGFPAIFTFIEYIYGTIQNYGDYVDFVHFCFHYEENTLDEKERKYFGILASNLYSLEMQISYESKQIELLVQKL